MKARIKPTQYFDHNTLANVKKDARSMISEEIMSSLGENMDSMILYTLASHFGFGKNRLRKFHELYILNTKFLGKRFCMEEEPGYISSTLLNRSGYMHEDWLKEDLAKWEQIKDEVEDMTVEEFNDFCEQLGEKAKI